MFSRKSNSLAHRRIEQRLVKLALHYSQSHEEMPLERSIREHSGDWERSEVAAAERTAARTRALLNQDAT